MKKNQFKQSVYIEMYNFLKINNSSYGSFAYTYCSNAGVLEGLTRGTKML